MCQRDVTKEGVLCPASVSLWGVGQMCVYTPMVAMAVAGEA